MIKRGLIIVFLLLSVSFVSAQENECNIEKGGVKINGDCYDCGNLDKICPEDYGAECKVIDPDCNRISSFFAGFFRKLFSFLGKQNPYK